MGRRLITGAPALSSGPQTDHVKRAWQWKPTKEWPSVDSLNTSRDVGTALTQEDQQDTLARLATVPSKAIPNEGVTYTHMEQHSTWLVQSYGHSAYLEQQVEQQVDQQVDSK